MRQSLILILCLSFLICCNNTRANIPVALNCFNDIVGFVNSNKRFPDEPELKNLSFFKKNAKEINFNPKSFIRAFTNRKKSIVIEYNDELFLFTCEKEYLENNEKIAAYQIVEKREGIIDESYKIVLSKIFVCINGKTQNATGRIIESVDIR